MRSMRSGVGGMTGNPRGDEEGAAPQTALQLVLEGAQSQRLGLRQGGTGRLGQGTTQASAQDASDQGEGGGVDGEAARAGAAPAQDTAVGEIECDGATVVAGGVAAGTGLEDGVVALQREQLPEESRSHRRPRRLRQGA